ncbi:MarR family transcriptional regulator [Rhodococcoides trifolii]|uniref:MarR family transcriptional regulator n=1 Tax=Rhodococcoides trifolii TaxID=908250 RepID=A0A917FPS1_9NOCA|nr:sugar-binding domain-containing protein [Rhodococcus trifolii]GGF93270.1 MarR family transcriptional regulator [Rhodococcus trifolii]
MTGAVLNTDDLRLALRAATMYHLDGATQAEIAAKLGVSRPTAGRLVARARAQGLVRIEIRVPDALGGSVHPDLERSVERKFGIDEVLIVNSNVDEHDGRYDALGRAAASVLIRRVQPSHTIGFTWGPETVAVAHGLANRTGRCARVVQLDGSMSAAADYQTGVDYVLGQCAEKFSASTMRLNAPLYADPATVTALHQDSVMSKALEAGRSADVMFFGLGPVSTSTTLFEGSFIDSAVLSELDELGAVGEVGGRFFTSDGSDVGGSLPPRTMSVSLDDIRACAHTILISGGARKHEAILGALRGGLAKILVTDIACAHMLLDS